MTCSRLHHEWAAGEERFRSAVSQPPEQRELLLWRGLEEKQLEKTNSTLTVIKFYPILCSFVGRGKKKKRSKSYVCQKSFLLPN